MRRKGLSIFHKLFIAFLGVAFITITISGAVRYRAKKEFIERTIKLQLTDSLERSTNYFNRTFNIPIKKDLGFIEQSSSLNNFLTSQRDEALLTKPPVERLFLYFTKMPESIYLSSRFIDSKGREKIITVGKRRVRDYTTIDHFPNNVLYQRIYSLFERLKKENVGSILFEGPFRYKNNKHTFVIGISKMEPEIGGFGGAIIFLCDLTGYLNYLSDIKFYQIPIAFVFSPDNHVMLSPEKEVSHDPDLYQSQEENINNALVVSSSIKLGSNNNVLLNLAFIIPRKIFSSELRNALIDSVLIGVCIIFLVGFVTFFISRRLFAKPIKELSRGTERIGRGDLDYRIKIKTHDEIAQLADEFNRMTEGLQKTTVSRDKLIQEVGERKRAEEALRESEEKFRMLSDQSLLGIMILQDDVFKYVNQAQSGILEYSIEEILNWEPKEYANVIHPDDRNFVMEQARKKQLGGEDIVVSYEVRVGTKTGKVKWTEIYSKTISFGGRSADFITMIDITERKLVEEQIKASLKEKEVLLQEIHHRVKNNMQVIIGLLKLQSASIKDEQYAEIFKESQDRIRSMALIHEKLYQSEDFSNVDFNGYVKTLVNGLFKSYGVVTNKIKKRLEVDNVSLGIDSAIPCGLVINELVTNSLKYAFPKDKKGEIKIALRSINGDEIDLRVTDDGIGLPEDLDFNNTESFGLGLVKMLVEGQLKGKIEINRAEGIQYHIHFKKPSYSI